MKKDHLHVEKVGKKAADKDVTSSQKNESGEKKHSRDGIDSLGGYESKDVIET